MRMLRMIADSNPRKSAQAVLSAFNYKERGEDGC